MFETPLNASVCDTLLETLAHQRTPSTLHKQRAATHPTPTTRYHVPDKHTGTWQTAALRTEHYPMLHTQQALYQVHATKRQRHKLKRQIEETAQKRETSRNPQEYSTRLLPRSNRWTWYSDRTNSKGPVNTPPQYHQRSVSTPNIGPLQTMNQHLGPQ